MVRSPRITSLYFFAAFFLGTLTAPRSFALSESQKASLQQQVSAEIRKASLADASWGVLALDATTNDILFNYNATRAFIPASNRKLFTTAFALTSMGAEFR